MVNVGPLEILLVAIIALIVLGPARLPEVARSLGRGMREFRTALSSAAGDDDEDDEDFDDEIPEAEAAEPPPLPKEPPGSPAEPAEDGAEPTEAQDLPEGR